MMNKPTLRVSIRKDRKRIYISRSVIAMLDNPSHLGFRYVREENLLAISATNKDDRNGFEIPKCFWKSSRSCEIARIAFFIALKYRLNWEDEAKYTYAGTLIELMGFPAVVFNMTNGTKVS